MSTVAQMQDALAAQISSVLCGTANPVIPKLQVDARMNPGPTPPSIDIYPAEPFTEAMGMGKGNKDFFFAVRARVDMGDNKAGQDLLLAMMDPSAATSVEQAILSNTELGNVAHVKNVDGPTAFGLFVSPGQINRMELLGCVWTVRVSP